MSKSKSFHLVNGKFLCPCPPPGLPCDWRNEGIAIGEDRLQWYVAYRGAQWGWDQREPEIQQVADDELEACCEWLRDAKNHGCGEDFAKKIAERLRASRRPPNHPSAVKKLEEAQSLIERHQDGWVPNPAQWDVIREGLAEGRRALEALLDD